MGRGDALCLALGGGTQLDLNKLLVCLLCFAHSKIRDDARKHMILTSIAVALAEIGLYQYMDMGVVIARPN